MNSSSYRHTHCGQSRTRRGVSGGYHTSQKESLADTAGKFPQRENLCLLWFAETLWIVIPTLETCVLGSARLQYALNVVWKLESGRRRHVGNPWLARRSPFRVTGREGLRPGPLLFRDSCCSNLDIEYTSGIDFHTVTALNVNLGPGSLPYMWQSCRSQQSFLVLMIVLQYTKNHDPANEFFVAMRLRLITFSHSLAWAAAECLVPLSDTKWVLWALCWACVGAYRVIRLGMLQEARERLGYVLVSVFLSFFLGRRILNLL